jgi:hypothetical protein
MVRWQSWRRNVLRDGDIVCRLGDARVVRGKVALSRFIALATGSPFSHAGIVAIEDGSAVVYDCSSAGIQRQPFEVWMLDSIGPLGVKRLKAEHRKDIAGVMDYCRAAFDRQVPFDYGFRMEDDALYCLELTEKAFRSQGLALSEPVRIGDLGIESRQSHQANRRTAKWTRDSNRRRPRSPPAISRHWPLSSRQSRTWRLPCPLRAIRRSSSAWC